MLGDEQKEALEWAKERPLVQWPDGSWRGLEAQIGDDEFEPEVIAGLVASKMMEASTAGVVTSVLGFAALKMQARSNGIERWLKENAPYISSTQKHLDENTAERAYWHYGYRCALLDVLRLMQKTD